MLVILSGCLENSENILVPHTGPVTLQLHNFNSLGSIIEEGTAPLIHYFVQRMDGSYSFTMSMDKTAWESSDSSFETDWSKEYVYVKLDRKGIIASSFSKKFSENGGFEHVNSEFPDRYQVLDEKLIYAKWNTASGDEQKIIKLNPESGVARTFSNYTSFDYFCDYCPPNSVFMSSDNNLIAVNRNQLEKLEYCFFSEEGNLHFIQNLPLKDEGFYTSDKGYFSHFLTKRNEDYYFLNSAVDPTQAHWYELEYSSSASSFFLMNDFPSPIKPNYTVEIKFGSNHRQNVYCYTSSSAYTSPSEYKYADFKELPFQAWDVTNNRQLNIGFNDINKDGFFSRGEVLLITDSNYSSSPDNAMLTVNGGISGLFSHMVQAYWYNTATIVSVLEKNAPRGLLKINAQGISPINSEVFSGLSTVRTIHDVKTYKDGFAILCNTSHYLNSDDVSADVILLDNNFSAEQAVQSSETLSQEKIVSNGSAILFSAVSKSSTLQLVTIKNGIHVKKDLTDLAQFTIENFQVTPTINGGWAILAWVWQTPDSRDLLFMEFDENLELVRN